MKLLPIIEALLVASEKPLSADQLGRLIRITASELGGSIENKSYGPEDIQKLEAITTSQVLNIIFILNQSYENDGRSFKLVEQANGWKIFVNPQYSEFISQLFPEEKSQRLSGPAIETLAIVSYRQPITKAAMESVRGVSCDGMIQKLMDRDLIFISGRAELPGRPLLYRTTKKFLEYLGVKSIEDLPKANELRISAPGGAQSKNVIAKRLNQPEAILDSNFDTQDSQDIEGA